MSVADRACEYLDRTSASDPSRIIIMDLLDEISSRDGEIESLQRALEVLLEVGALKDDPPMSGVEKSALE